jgi:hypothetical protein
MTVVGSPGRTPCKLNLHFLAGIEHYRLDDAALLRT